MNRKRLALFLAGLGVIIAGAGILVYTLAPSSTAPAPPVAIAPTSVPPEPTAVAEVVPAEPASFAVVSRLVIPRIAVDATTTTLGVDPDGSMQTPGKPMDVAWYRFSAKPGQNGNIVMAGHVDYLNFGPAVFARLRELQSGDEVILENENGVRFTYRVASTTTYVDVPEAVAEVTGPTSKETVTLITCGGTFNHATGQYDRRLVIRAERV